MESLTLRVTTLRAFDGTLHLVPNGNIQIVSNKSRGWARAIVDVRVAYGEDVDRVRGILEQLFEEFQGDPTLHDWIREGPSVLGVETMADYGLVSGSSPTPARPGASTPSVSSESGSRPA